MLTGLRLSVRQVILLLPLVAAFGYDGQVEHQQNDPVAGVQDRPRYQQGFLRLTERLLCFTVDRVGHAPEQHHSPHCDWNGADEVDHDLPAARGAPPGLVDGEQGKYFGGEQAGHVEQGVERHEDHDQAAPQEAGVGGLHHPHQLHRQQEEQDVPEPPPVEEMDDGGDQEEGEEAGDHGLVGHPETVLVEPQGVVKPLTEVRLAPSSLLVEPAQVLGRRLRLALRARRELGLVAEAEHPVGEVAVVSEAALGAQEGLVVPGLQEALQQGVPVHPQGAADALDAAEVGLAGPLDVEGHPVAYAAEEGDPRVVLVEDLEDGAEEKRVKEKP